MNYFTSAVRRADSHRSSHFVLASMQGSALATSLVFRRESDLDVAVFEKLRLPLLDLVNSKHKSDN